MKTYIPTIKIFTLALCLMVFVNVLAAVSPIEEIQTLPAPQGNLDQPINVGSTDQSKSGILFIKNGLSIFGGTTATNKVHVDGLGRLGIGISASELTAESSGTSLLVDGKVKVTDITGTEICTNGTTGAMIECGTGYKNRYTVSTDYFTVPTGVTSIQVVLNAPQSGSVQFGSVIATRPVECGDTYYGSSAEQAFLRLFTPVAHATETGSCYQTYTDPQSTRYSLVLQAASGKKTSHILTVVPGDKYRVIINNVSNASPNSVEVHY